MSSKKIFALVLFALSFFFLFFPNKNFSAGGQEANANPMFCVGSGYVDGGENNSGTIVQLEYKFGNRFWGHLRPQISLNLPELRSIFLGIGIGWECALTEKMTLTPSFSPGLYIKGKGRDLGFPLEFRSAIELSYKFDQDYLIGFQVYHLSNAHLGRKNPGINAYVLFLGIPLKW